MRNERQGTNWLGAVQAAVLLGWIIALCWLGHGSGDDPLLGQFLRSDYWWIVYTATGIFIALLASLAVSQPRQFGLERRRSLIQAILLSLPLFYLPLASSSELSIEAAEKRSLFTPRVRVERFEPPKPMMVSSVSDEAAKSNSLHTPRLAVENSELPKPTQIQRTFKTPRDPSKSAQPSVKPHRPTLWDLVSNPEAFDGSNATVVGMVYTGKRLSANSFFCYRLLMVCCAADASPAGVLVKWQETPKLKKGSWVKVHGRLGSTMFEGESCPTILATTVERTSPPKNRYLIPE